MAQSASNQVKRELKTRHLSMIALGGSIGTGLFVASGSAIATAGPVEPLQPISESDSWFSFL